MKNSQHSWSVERGALFIICAACWLFPVPATAAPEGAEDGPISKLLEAAIPDAKDKGQSSYDKLTVEMSSLSPLPGGYRNKGAGDESGGSGQPEEDLGPKSKPATGLHLPAMKGFRELADAQPVQDMFKGLITKKVPVLFQTMMMVENGAATGFIGSMQAVSNVLSNQVETTQLSFQLDDMLDPSGQRKFEHGGAIVNALNRGGDVKTWPHALWDASGDSPTANIDTDAIKTVEKNEPADHGDNPGEQSNGTTAKTELDFNKDLLFPQRPEGSDEDASFKQYQYEQSGIPELEKEFFTYVGNIKQTQELVSSGTDKLAVKNSEKLFKGQEKDGRWGLERRAYEESKAVWKNMSKLVNKVCKFKKDNANNGQQPGKKKLPSIGSNFFPEELKGSSAPDIQMTAILLEQIFMISKPNVPYKDIDCEQDYSTDSNFPNGEFAEVDPSDPDSCKGGGGGAGGGVKGCLRLRVLNHVSTLIGRSRALYYFGAMHNVTARFVQDPVAARMHDELFENVIGPEPIARHIDKNRDVYERFILYLARYMQGQQSTGTVFKPNTSNAMPNNGPGFGESKS